ncbi:hypothetical protein Y032_0011g1537 [Ancylostoma ceylanicum]|uniref:Uncharacterized protein n=1 Tax=Ancylostoma ceylanicum TaxID=53326 RepID=A0A016VGE4_9BILA|nr:hypothetical protein Y032_0011g1537 [Ancylostoma ceylanicum]
MPKLLIDCFRQLFSSANLGHHLLPQQDWVQHRFGSSSPQISRPRMQQDRTRRFFTVRHQYLCNYTEHFRDGKFKTVAV